MPDATPSAAQGLLERLPGPARDRLFATAIELDVPRGAVLYRESGAPRCGLVRSGLIRVYVTSGEGRHVTIRYARRGDLLGVAVAVAGPSPVAVQAVTDSNLLMFDVRALVHEAQRDPAVAWAVAEELGRRLYEAIDHIAVNAFGTLRERIARHLLDSALPGKQGLPVANVTQQELADAVGSSREAVARTLRGFREDRLVRTRPGGVVLLAPEELARISVADRVRV